MERFFYWYANDEISIFLCYEGSGKRESIAKPKKTFMEILLDGKNNPKGEVFYLEINP